MLEERAEGDRPPVAQGRHRHGPAGLPARGVADAYARLVRMPGVDPAGAGDPPGQRGRPWRIRRRGPGPEFRCVTAAGTGTAASRIPLAFPRGRIRCGAGASSTTPARMGAAGAHAVRNFAVRGQPARISACAVMGFETRVIAVKRVTRAGGTVTAARVARGPGHESGRGCCRLRGRLSAQCRSGTPVIVAGRRAPLVGRVSMDMLTVDVTDLGPVRLVNRWSCGAESCGRRGGRRRADDPLDPHLRG